MTAQIRRRKETLLVSLDMLSDEHPMQKTYISARKCVNELLRYVYRIEDTWTPKNVITASVSSLIDQLVRSATSVTANMQEGFGKASRESLTVFLRIARGSLYETLDHLVSIKHLVKIDDGGALYIWTDLKCLFDSEFQQFTEESIELVQAVIDKESIEKTSKADATVSTKEPASKRRKTSDSTCVSISSSDMASNETNTNI